jgi:hypothetical protein
MKKIGIVLAALVIATFMVGTVAAIQPIPDTYQPEYFKEKSCVQGTGDFMISKTILNKAIAIEVDELIQGTGNFAMDSREIMNEFATKEGLNYEHNKMIQYDNGGVLGDRMIGGEMYTSPAFHGGTGAMVEEFFNVEALQKIETVEIFTMADVSSNQSLVFDTCDQFKGIWGTNAEWKKTCKKDIELAQMFDGDFAVQKKLVFEEHVRACEDKDC